MNVYLYGHKIGIEGTFGNFKARCVSFQQITPKLGHNILDTSLAHSDNRLYLGLLNPNRFESNLE